MARLASFQIVEANVPEIPGKSHTLVTANKHWSQGLLGDAAFIDGRDAHTKL
jgi:hypothetical protein